MTVRLKLLAAVGALAVLLLVLGQSGPEADTTSGQGSGLSAKGTKGTQAFLLSIATDLDKSFFENAPPLPPGKICNDGTMKGIIPLATLGGQYRMGSLNKNGHLHNGSAKCQMPTNKEVPILAARNNCFLIELNEPCDSAGKINNGYIPIGDLNVGALQSY